MTGAIDRDGLSGTQPPLVSVVVVSGRMHDGNTVLIESLRRQTMPRWEVIDAGGVAGIADVIKRVRGEFVLVASGAAALDPTFLEKCFWFLGTHPRYAFVNAHERRRVGDESLSTYSTGFYDKDAVVRSGEIGLHVVMRKYALLELGGFDRGLDPSAAIWDFWLRAAEAGHWGSTIPEVLIERPVGVEHGDPDARVLAAHGAVARGKFARLFAGHVPAIEPRWPRAYESVRAEAPGTWRMGRRVSHERYIADGKGKPAERRRLLLIAPWLRMGGADKFNLDLCRRLRERGWELTIACTAPSGDEWLGMFREHTRDIFLPHKFLHWADYPILLRSLIETREPDVVLISNSELAYHLVPYFRAYCPEPVYVDYVHMEEESWKSGGHARHSVGMHDQLDLTMVTSEHLRKWMESRGAGAGVGWGRIDVCPIGVDHRRWRADERMRRRVRGELGISDQMPVILHAGRICEQKQPGVLGRALQILKQRGVEYTALIAGDGDDRGWVEKFIAEHGLGSQVRMLGERTPEQMRWLMGAADIFFLPSKWEGVALVLYETMAMGESGGVFVGADVGGQGEVATPETAVLLDVAGMPNPEAQAVWYADAIAGLLADPQRRRRMGEAARRRIAEGFTEDRMVELFLGSVEKAMRLQREDPRRAFSPGLAQEMAARAVEMVRLEWHAGQLWKERDYWKASGAGGGSGTSGGGGVVVESVGPRRGAVGRLLRAIRRGR
ncbi:MAG: glycosyltransferase [Phycisphaerales bacterium]|nr:glycosyltransferase [Phycisphaerales bacterium]